MEIMHLPKFERLTHEEPRKKKSQKDPEKPPTPDSAYQSSADASPSSRKRGVGRAPSSGFGSSSHSNSTIDLHENFDTVSLNQDPGPSESQTENTEVLLPDFYGVLHGPDYSIVTVKILRTESDLVSLNEQSADSSAEKETQTVAMPMLWSTPRDFSLNLSSQTSLYPLSSPSVEEIAPETRPVPIVQDVIEPPQPASGCLENSRRQLWHAVTACRSYLRLEDYGPLVYWTTQ